LPGKVSRMGCTGDVGRRAAAEQLTGAAATDGDGWVQRADVDLGDPRARMDLCGAWRSGGATLGGRTRAAHGEVTVVAGGGMVEGFSGCWL
jgi:hypothetical protein